MRLVLGSRSEGRKKVLQKMGYIFDIIPADIDEKAIRSLNPGKLVKDLAHAKATAILPILKDFGLGRSILITSDQVVICNGLIREKPASTAEVKENFETYQTHPAETITSVVVTDVYSGCRLWGVDRAKVWFRPIPPTIVNYYIVSKDPFERAGGFDHEHPIINPYVDRIEGESESITGLPVGLTRRLLAPFKT